MDRVIGRAVAGRRWRRCRIGWHRVLASLQLPLQVFHSQPQFLLCGRWVRCRWLSRSRSCALLHHELEIFSLAGIRWRNVGQNRSAIFVGPAVDVSRTGGRQRSKYKAKDQTHFTSGFAVPLYACPFVGCHCQQPPMRLPLIWLTDSTRGEAPSELMLKPIFRRPCMEFGV